MLLSTISQTLSEQSQLSECVIIPETYMGIEVDSASHRLAEFEEMAVTTGSELFVAEKKHI